MPYATLEHMEIGLRDLRNQTGRVIEAVEAGEPVVLTVHGRPVAEIVPHSERRRWKSGERLRAELVNRSADQGLSRELDELTGQIIDHP